MAHSVPHKKILFITPFYPPNIGGAETFCADLFNELSKTAEVKVCSIDWGNNKTFKGTGLRQFLEVFPKMLTLTVSEFVRQKPDLCYCIGLNAALIGAILNATMGLKNVGVLLALYKFASVNPIMRAFSAFSLNRMNKIYVEGQSGKRDLAGLGIPESKIIIFQHWCDQDIFKPNRNRNGWKLRVLFVGRPIFEKGKHIIQEIEQRLNHLKGLEFVYVENCRFQDLPKYYQMADVCVVPSLYPEGFCRVVIESASCGCAVIASNRGSLPEMVNNFGIVCEPEEFGKWIKTLYEDREILRRLQKQSLEYARKNFTNKNAEVFHEKTF